MKFGRNYRITIQKSDGSSAIIIQPPLTIRFTVNRSSMSDLNNLTLEIYNLAQATRDLIFHDRFQFETRDRIIFEVGYGDQLSVIFIGTITVANSARVNSDVITYINALDGAYDVFNTQTYKTLQKGSTIKDVMMALIGDFPNLKAGAVSDRDKTTFQRPIVLDGNSYHLMQRYADINGVYIDLEKVYHLDANEVLSDTAVPVLSSDTGLLGTPRRDQAFLTAQFMLEPAIIMGQVVELQSIYLPQYNGQYKVIGVQHEGIISEAVGGTASSTFNLLNGKQLYGGFTPVDVSEKSN